METPNAMSAPVGALWVSTVSVDACDGAESGPLLDAVPQLDSRIEEFAAIVVCDVVAVHESKVYLSMNPSPFGAGNGWCNSKCVKSGRL